MRIQPIITNQQTKTYQNKVNAKQPKNVSFEGWKISGKNILEANAAELREYAEYLHKINKNSLIEISKVKNTKGIDAIPSMEAYATIREAINNVVTQKNNWTNTVISLEEKAERNGFLTNEQNETLIKHRVLINNLDNKAAQCHDKLYQEENHYEEVRTYAGDPTQDPVTNMQTHYDG